MSNKKVTLPIGEEDIRLFQELNTLLPPNEPEFDDNNDGRVDRNPDGTWSGAQQYRLNNIEVVKEKAKHHYEKNKEEILEKMKEKTICECGCEVRLTGLSRHKRSAKHIKLMQI